MTNDLYEIVRYTPELKPRVAELQRELWSSDVDLNRRFLAWKYEESPFAQEALVFLALHRGAVVGMRGFNRGSWEAGTPSRAFPVWMAGDALVSHVHRDRGLVTRIMRAAHAELAGRDCRYLISVAPSRINTFGLLTLGWKSVGGLRPMGRAGARAARIRRVRRIVGRLPFFWRYRDARFLRSADERRPFRQLDSAAQGDSIVAEKTPRVDDMAELIASLGHDGRIRHVRNRDYLAWRFRNPLNDYRFLFWEGSRLEGYLVLTHRASDLGSWDRVYIADLEARDPRIRSELLAAAVHRGRFSELVTWTASLTEDELSGLASLGFTAVDPEDAARGCPCVLVRAAGDEPSTSEWVIEGRPVLDSRSWDVRVLYSMRG